MSFEFDDLPEPTKEQWDAWECIEKMRKEIDRAIARTTAHADPLWLKEMTVCVYLTALDNRFLDVDTVWATFRQRKAYNWPVYNKTALGGMMRKAASMGWIQKVHRPEGAVVTSNHNSAGTSYWASNLYAVSGDVTEIIKNKHCILHPAAGTPEQMRLI